MTTEDRLPSVVPPLPIGTVVGDGFKLASILGRGASGVVYLAECQNGAALPNRPAKVAMKVIHRELSQNAQIFGRYKREAKILGRLTGKHLVRLLDFIEHDGLLVIALDYVDGSPLDTVLREPIEVDHALDLSIQIADGLAEAHACGVIHRDLKPANVIIEPRGWPKRATPGEPPRLRILDFGLAKIVHGDKDTTGLTSHDMIFGTPEYMAPEQARGDDPDPRSDVYAAGVMLYEMCTGAVPFSKRGALATMTAQLTEEVIPPRTKAPHRGISPALEEVILRCLEKESKYRHATAVALAESLRAVKDGSGETTRRAISLGPISRPSDGTGEDASMELGETDLDIRLSQVSPERRAGAEVISSRRTPSPTGATSSAPPEMIVEPGKGNAVWFVAVAIVALVAVGIGVILAVH